MSEPNVFSRGALCLSVITAAAAECLLRADAPPPARTAVLWGAVQAGCLALLALLGAAAAGRGRRLACLVLAAWLCAEWAQELWQAHLLCRRQFLSSAVLGAAPLLLWAGLRVCPAALSRTARVLWGFALCAALAAALGLGGQLRWERLAVQEGGAWPAAAVYAEYFALPYLCGEPDRRCAGLLPWAGFLVQAGFALGWGLLFGAAARGYAGAELMRALAAGAFSRLDAFCVGIWLLLALYRVCFLGAAVRVLVQRALPGRAREGAC